ncbi:biotin-dependent carboxyltransferase family protein [Psychromonas hadalis]|uniref:5-oxoprolinase subunit C family protein n=1 Tax=Psychromonas hadalis TaxID=211669 RepID=UPI0003B4ED54|nr:biotin-dependent carboxyltransferase family protein [Psychromonas hadalis]
MNIESGLRVKKAGIFTQLQDQGRFYQAQQGVSQGGVCDELAGGWANYLLDNPVNSPLLEISFGQAQFEALSEVQLALTGAPMDAKITLLSGKQIKQHNNCSFILKQGELLTLSFATSGLRAYLAVKGGFIAEAVLGSVSCVKRNSIGGLQGDGGVLKKGDLLPVLSQQRHFIKRKMPEQFIPNYNQPLSLAVIESYQCDDFLVSQKNRFYNSEYQIDKHSDRMGMRLQGEPIIKSGSAGIISEGIALGSIQIPADGLPIILLQDRQTLGGYPKIGCVSRCDLSQLAQQPAGNKITFKRSDLQVEQLRYLQQLRFFNI